MTTTATATCSLADSHEWCKSLAKDRAGNFYVSFLALPRDRFRDMCALYGFMRVCDDIGDDPAVPCAQRSQRLAEWREQVALALEGERIEHPALPALCETVRRCRIPQQYLFDVIDGVQADLHPRQFRTFQELSDYCYQVAGAVGLCCIHIWGFHNPRAAESAIDCGLAFQLTNILRDLGEDALMDRMYLPQEDLERFGYTRDDIAQHRRDERFERLMRFEVERAREYYSRAQRLLEYLDPPGRAILSAMMDIYGGLLSKIERRRYDVFTARIRLPRWQKLMLVGKAVVWHRWLRR